MKAEVARETITLKVNWLGRLSLELSPTAAESSTNIFTILACVLCTYYVPVPVCCVLQECPANQILSKHQTPSVNTKNIFY